MFIKEIPICNLNNMIRLTLKNSGPLLAFPSPESHSPEAAFLNQCSSLASQNTENDLSNYFLNSPMDGI